MTAFSQRSRHIPPATVTRPSTKTRTFLTNNYVCNAPRPNKAVRLSASEVCSGMVSGLFAHNSCFLRSSNSHCNATAQRPFPTTTQPASNLQWCAFTRWKKCDETNRGFKVHCRLLSTYVACAIAWYLPPPIHLQWLSRHCIQHHSLTPPSLAAS